MRRRVFGDSRSAFARKAGPRGERSWAGGPVAARRAYNIRSKGAKEMTEASNCICPFSGPTDDCNSGNNSSCNMGANCVTTWREESSIWGWLGIRFVSRQKLNLVQPHFKRFYYILFFALSLPL